jgi:hypothetical protein
MVVVVGVEDIMVVKEVVVLVVVWVADLEGSFNKVVLSEVDEVVVEVEAGIGAKPYLRGTQMMT